MCVCVSPFTMLSLLTKMCMLKSFHILYVCIFANVYLWSYACCMFVWVNPVLPVQDAAIFSISLQNIDYCSHELKKKMKHTTTWIIYLWMTAVIHLIKGRLVNDQPGMIYIIGMYLSFLFCCVSNNYPILILNSKSKQK